MPIALGLGVGCGLTVNAVAPSSVTKESFLASLSAYWACEFNTDGPGNPNLASGLFDSTTNANHVLSENGNFDSAVGKVSQGLYCPGSDSMHIGSNSTIKISHQATVLFAVDPNTDADNGGFDDTRAIFYKNEFYVFIESVDSLHFQVRCQVGSTSYALTPSIDRSGLTLVAVVWDGTQIGNAARLIIEVNGVAQTLTFFGPAIPASIDDADDTLRIAGDGADADLIGRLDEIAFLNGVIPPAKRLHYYTNVNAGLSPIPA